MPVLCYIDSFWGVVSGVLERMKCVEALLQCNLSSRENQCCCPLPIYFHVFCFVFLKEHREFNVTLTVKKGNKTAMQTTVVNISVMDTCIQRQAWVYDSFRPLEKLCFLTSAFTLPDGSFFKLFCQTHPGVT